MGDLTEAFDKDRLLGNARLLPDIYAIIPQSVVTALPHYVMDPVNGRFGCRTLTHQSVT
jgi:hypothetical protein